MAQRKWFNIFFRAALFAVMLCATKPLPAVAQGSSASAVQRFTDDLHSLYNDLGLAANGLSYEAFQSAAAGYVLIKSQASGAAQNILAIADFSEPSHAQRFYVIDLSARRLLYHTFVAHGRASGDDITTAFSNRPESYMSSLGFYTTAGTYQGSHGLSLSLHGLEAGINDQAEARRIVMHGAPYVSAEFVRANGRLGRSLGCPALPTDQAEAIIKTLEPGAVLFAYYPDLNYLHASTYLDLNKAAAAYFSGHQLAMLQTSHHMAVQ